MGLFGKKKGRKKATYAVFVGKYKIGNYKGRNLAEAVVRDAYGEGYTGKSRIVKLKKVV